MFMDGKEAMQKFSSSGNCGCLPASQDATSLPLWCSVVVLWVGRIPSLASGMCLCWLTPIRSLCSYCHCSIPRACDHLVTCDSKVNVWSKLNGLIRATWFHIFLKISHVHEKIFSSAVVGSHRVSMRQCGLRAKLMSSMVEKTDGKRTKQNNILGDIVKSLDQPLSKPRNSFYCLRDLDFQPFASEHVLSDSWLGVLH